MTEGTCIFVKGEATIIRGTEKIKVIKNGLVYENDLIKVAPKSLVLIKFKYQTIKLIETSTIKVAQLEKEYMKISLDSGGMIINQLKKKLRENSQERAPLEIKTASASIGVRGTTFFAFQGKNGETVLSVKEGTVGFQSLNSVNEVSVTDDSSSMSNADFKNLKPRKFGFEKEINFNFDSTKDLESSENLISQLEKSWKKYKNEQEFVWLDKKNNEESQWDQWKKLNN